MKAWRAILSAALLFTAAAPAHGVPLDGRYEAFVAAARACVAATGPEGVDRKAIATAGWPAESAGEIDHNAVAWAHSERNPFLLRINSFSPLEPEQCWFTAEFEELRDYDEVLRRLVALFGRAPDESDSNNMRGARWRSAGSIAELWMMPAHELCSECPTMFFSVEPLRAE